MLCYVGLNSTEYSRLNSNHSKIPKHCVLNRNLRLIETLEYLDIFNKLDTLDILDILDTQEILDLLDTKTLHTLKYRLDIQEVLNIQVENVVKFIKHTCLNKGIGENFQKLDVIDKIFLFGKAQRERLLWYDCSQKY